MLEMAENDDDEDENDVAMETSDANGVNWKVCFQLRKTLLALYGSLLGAMETNFEIDSITFTIIILQDFPHNCYSYAQIVHN